MLDLTKLTKEILKIKITIPPLELLLSSHHVVMFLLG